MRSAHAESRNGVRLSVGICWCLTPAALSSEQPESCVASGPDFAAPQVSGTLRRGLALGLKLGCRGSGMPRSMKFPHIARTSAAAFVAVAVSGC